MLPAMCRQHRFPLPVPSRFRPDRGSTMKQRRPITYPAPSMQAYVPRRVPQLETLMLRGLQCQLYRWPGADPHPVVLLHGWGDTGATWQFLVDECSPSRSWLALDFRGFGRTQRAAGGYWFPDYLADLDALLDHLSPDVPVDLVGHSMGGNVASLYAGVRPHRVRRLVNLEGFGLEQAHADQAPGRYAEWLDQVRRPRRTPTYDNYQQLLRVLARRHPRIPPQRLAFIARAWAREREDGSIELRADPAHRHVNPVLYQRDQAQACWRRIEAAVLLVSGDLSEHAQGMEKETSGDWLRQAATAMVTGAGHMLQHERPQELAELVESFLSD